VSLELALVTLGLSAVRPRPPLPDGVLRRFTDPDKMKRDVPRYFNPAERRADIVKYIRANGPVTISDLCELTGADIGTVGSDVRTLRREGRISEAGWDRIPSGGKQKLWRLADAEQA
jgi:hypothetical protein